MDDFGDPANVGFKDAQGVGIGQHQRGDIAVHAFFQLLEIDHAPVIGLDLLYGVTGQVGAGGVGPMGRIGHQDVLAGIPLLFQVGPDQHHAGQFALGSGRRLHGEGVQPGDLAEVILHPLDDFQAALDGIRRGQGVGGRKSREGGHLLVDLGIVLHGARAERIKPDVDAIVLLGQAGEVADQLDLRDLGKIDDFGPHSQVFEGVLGFGHVQLGQSEGPLPLVADFEDERFADHRSTSSRAAVKASMQALVLTSVTQTRSDRSMSL